MVMFQPYLGPFQVDTACVMALLINTLYLMRSKLWRFQNTTIDGCHFVPHSYPKLIEIDI